MKLNFQGLEMQKWNIPRDRAQKEAEKNGFIYHVIIFTPGVMVIKMPKMAHFVFSADDSQKSVRVWAEYSSTSEKYYLALSVNTTDCWILSYHQQNLNP